RPISHGGVDTTGRRWRRKRRGSGTPSAPGRSTSPATSRRNLLSRADILGRKRTNADTPRVTTHGLRPSGSTPLDGAANTDGSDRRSFHLSPRWSLDVS